MGKESYSPSNPSQVNAERKDADKIRQSEIADLKKLLDTEWGRRIVWRLLSRAGIYEISYNLDGPRDAVIFKEGRREIGLFLMAEIHAARPDAYMLMIEENKHA